MDPPGADQKHDITGLLRAWRAGTEGALDHLSPLVYEELRQIAERYMKRERKEHTLQPTALVNEAFVRLVTISGVEWQDRAHFFGLAAQMMRRILVNYALARASSKRGARAQRVTLDEGIVMAPEREGQIVALDDALKELAKFDARKARVVELRFFGGLSVEETAAVLNVSQQTVLRDWSLAKAWLAREMDSCSR